MKERFDILLVLGHFRAASAYLSIIKHLSPQMRIGLLPAKVDPSFVQNTPGGQRVFLELSQRFGAAIVAQGSVAHTRLLIVQQYPYPPESAAEIRSNVRADRTVGLMGLTTAGLEKHDSFLAQFDVRKVYVPSVRLMRFLLAERGAARRFEDVDVIEVGLPFGKYPVFPEFEVDYLIAAPTVFSFHSEQGKHQFLHTVLSLLEQIPASACIAYKTHNGSAKDYFAPRLHYSIAYGLRRVPGSSWAIGAMASSAPKRVRRQLETIGTGMMHSRVLERAVPMTEITSYGDISLEAFLPGVRKGVIGGLSNTIWGTLYSQLPFYNCVDPRLREGNSELLPHRSSEALLDMNLRYFGVPYCGGDISRGARGENIVTEQDRRGDLIRAVKDDLEG